MKAEIKDKEIHLVLTEDEFSMTRSLFVELPNEIAKDCMMARTGYNREDFEPLRNAILELHFPKE